MIEAIDRRSLQHEYRLPAVLHVRIGPLGMNLSHIFLRHDIVIRLRLLPTILVVVDALGTVARDNLLAQQSDGFVGNLALTSALLGGLEVAYRIFSATTLWGGSAGG